MVDNDFSGLGDETVAFSSDKIGDRLVLECVSEVCFALDEKGYDPVGQMVGYLMSGDPVYITSYRGARKKILSFSREELLSSILRYYLR